MRSGDGKLAGGGILGTQRKAIFCVASGIVAGGLGTAIWSSTRLATVMPQVSTKYTQNGTLLLWSLHSVLSLLTIRP
jgi:hypothetical protein